MFIHPKSLQCLCIAVMALDRLAVLGLKPNHSRVVFRRRRTSTRKLRQWKFRNPETEPTFYSIRIQSNIQRIASSTSSKQSSPPQPPTYRFAHTASSPAPPERTSDTSTPPANRSHPPQPPAYRAAYNASPPAPPANRAHPPQPPVYRVVHSVSPPAPPVPPTPPANRATLHSL